MDHPEIDYVGKFRDHELNARAREIASRESEGEPIKVDKKPVPFAAQAMYIWIRQVCDLRVFAFFSSSWCPVCVSTFFSESGVCVRPDQAG